MAGGNAGLVLGVVSEWEHLQRGREKNDGALGVSLTWDPGLQSALQGHRCVWDKPLSPQQSRSKARTQAGWRLNW